MPEHRHHHHHHSGQKKEFSHSHDYYDGNKKHPHRCYRQEKKTGTIRQLQIHKHTFTSFLTSTSPSNIQCR